MSRLYKILREEIESLNSELQPNFFKIDEHDPNHYSLRVSQNFPAKHILQILKQEAEGKEIEPGLYLVPKRNMYTLAEIFKAMLVHGYKNQTDDRLSKRFKEMA